jgi:hypothetical protein
VLELECAGPLVDLLLTDAEGTAAFGQNCLTLPAAGVYRVPYTGGGAALEARSLAGKHALRPQRSPLA